ncbi:MAG: 6-bladed beta-propeller [Candidatus Firestonebacteria bacterium]|nr:6-bladed beta-propeller [Candidatus Firestonebacteria bacterium]
MRQQEKVAAVVIGLTVLVLAGAVFFGLKGGGGKAGNPVTSQAPERGRADGQFSMPRGVAVDADGFVYVVDSENHRVQKFKDTGEFVAKWGSEGTGDGQFKSPGGVAVGPDGFVYVADTWNHRIEKFDRQGKFITKWSGDGGFWGPRDVAVDEKFVYVTDTGNRRIQKFSLKGEFVKSWGKKGSGPDEYDEPFGIKIGQEGLLYICDRLNFRIQVCNPDGKRVRSFPLDGWQKEQFYMEPYLALDDARDLLYVTDPTKHRVHKFTRAGKFLGFIENDPATHAPLATPVGVVVNPKDGTVYITDMTANKLYKLKL